MAEPIIMPKQGQSVESCIISKWHKKKGDKVEKGDLLFSYETDKASFEEEAPVSGTLLDIFFEEEDDVPCLLNVCVIGQPGESTAEFNPNQTSDFTSNQEQGTSNTSESTSNQEPATSASPGSTSNQQPATSNQCPATSNQQPVSSTPSDSTRTLDHVSRISPNLTSNQEPVTSNKMSPRARNLAEKIGVDYRLATPTGPYGRIIEQDIIALRDSGLAFTQPAREVQLGSASVGTVQGTGLGGRITTEDLQKSLLQHPLENRQQSSGSESTAGAAPSAAVTSAAAIVGKPGTEQPQTSYEAVSITDPAYEEVKVPHIRKVIAQAMHQSLASTAQLTLNASFDATELLNYRKKLKETRERLGLENITLNDMILFAVSRTLLNHKDLNAHFLDDKMRYFKNVNLGVAIDTERGLMVPTIFGAELLSLNEISIQTKKLAADCKAGTINPDLLKNGSFTVTNLGTLDIESFTPVLNPPQTGILGVNNIVQRAREVNGDYEFYPAMGLSLTFDHRAVDGAPAARFLKELKTNLENFSVLLAR